MDWLFKTFEMLCSKQFSTTDRFGLDLFSFFNKHTEIVDKNIEYERANNKIWGTLAKISIHSLIADPIFTFCFRFEN